MPESHVHWHTIPAADAARLLESSLTDGLTPDEAGRRLAGGGPNILAAGRRPGPLRILLRQFTDTMILVLVAAAAVAGVVGEAQDSIAILAIVVLNGLLGFAQEYRAEQALAALRSLAAPRARVRRRGELRVVASTELVPGDLVALEAGNIVPADVRLLEATELRVQEATLTGESEPVDKTTGALSQVELPIGDRRNMAYQGTAVTHGRGAGVVVATGMETELGRIAALLDPVDPDTPLQRRLAEFAKRLGLIVLALCGIVFAMGIARGEPAGLMLLTAISLAVAAIPEALPAVVTVALALGARRMVSRHALVRRLPAVEALGSVTVICADKTGTLTQNRMQVDDVRGIGDGPDGSGAPVTGRAGDLLYTAIGLSHDAERLAGGQLLGDPTETALLLAAEHVGFFKAELERRYPRIAEIPFSSERGRMTTLHRNHGAILALTKGAPERVLPLCTDCLIGDRLVVGDHWRVANAVDGMAARGLRVLAVAFRRLETMPEPVAPVEIESQLTLVGLVGLRDPPRPEAAASIALCRSAGIHVVMITGDHPATARVIATELGILADGADGMMTGPELGRLSGPELQRQAGAVRVYARVAPEQKLAIVEALRRNGAVVAMTGDGVNDAPALRRADIGVAMGEEGTEVAREAADMVLLDDNFATIVAAVREGRRIFDNIRKFIRYALTCNSGEIWTLLLAPVLALPTPLLPVHILWINLVTDGLPGLALSVEPEEGGVMERPPRSPSESLFGRGLWRHVFWIGLLMAGITLLTQAWAYRTGSPHWQTMTFTVLTLSQLGHCLAIRSERQSLFRIGLRSNMPLLGAVVLTTVLQLGIIYLPGLRPIFRTTALTGTELIICLALSGVVAVAVEAGKWMARRGGRTPGS